MAKKQREMAVGLQLNPSFAQLTYYNTTMKEPVTAEFTAGDEEGRFLYPMPENVWKAACGLGQPIELLRDYFDECFQKTLPSISREQIHIMVVVPRLDRLLCSRLPQALELLGVERKNINLQDEWSAFYYYTVNQRKDLWNTDVALLQYRDEFMIGSVMHIDRTKSPAVVTVKEAGRQSVGEKARDGRSDEDWALEKDRLLFELLKKVFERRNVGTCYLVGDYYERGWALKSYQYLCSGRHAFQGENLFTRGACYAAMERCSMLQSSAGMLYLGEDIIKDNLGMNLRVNGKETYYPLISAGVNWYEARKECDLIVDGETDLTVISRPMDGGQEVEHLLHLNHLPKRPPRTTRLRITLYFAAPDCCIAEAEDLGFGGLYRATHRRWKRSIYI